MLCCVCVFLQVTAMVEGVMKLHHKDTNELETLMLCVSVLKVCCVFLCSCR